MDAKVKIDIDVSKFAGDNNEWDSYVKGHAEGTFFHLIGWQEVISASFGHDCHYLVAKKNGTVCGVLPLVHVKSALFGNALISTPFCVYGGAIANDDVALRALEKAACHLADSLQVDYLELRYTREQDNGLLMKHAHTTFGCEIAENDEAILAAIKKKQRAVIRHSFKSQLTTEITSELDKFYDVLSESYRNLGTPIFSKTYFENIMRVFANDADIYLIKNGAGDVSSAVLNFYYKNQVLPYYGGGTPDARALKSADFMYYQVMCEAAKKGLNWFDFGRSKNDSGPYNYKKNWGMQSTPLYYYYYLVKAKELPNLSPNNPKYKMFIQLWQKLPLKLSQLIGPFLSKYLG